MGLLSLITKSKLGLFGKTPKLWPGSSPQSKLHNQYSLNGAPNQPNQPSPSRLDLNGEGPKEYLNNLPK